MEERIRLIKLIQLLKGFDLDVLGSDENDSYNGKAAAAQDVESYAVVNQDINHYDSGNSGDHVNDDENEAFDRLSYICRKLDFSIDSTDCHQKLSCPVGSVHIDANHDSSTQHNQGRARAMPVQLHHAQPVVRNGKGNKVKSDIHSSPSDYNLGENFNPGITRGISMHNSNSKLSSITASAKTSKNEAFGPQNRKAISRKQSLRYADMTSTGSFGCIAKPMPVFKAKTAANYNYGLPLRVPVTPNKRRVGKPHIKVCVRKKPLTNAENRRNEVDVVTTPNGETVTIHESKDAVDLSPYKLEHSFYFDHVFGDGSSNEDVYEHTAYPLVQHMVNGGNATCFAYGQTGAGKTHTMLGSPERPGLYALAARDIFMHLSTTCTHPSPQVFVSFYEIYCGQLYDLLNHRARVFARENGQQEVHICGLHLVKVDSINSLLEVISHGTKARSQGSSGVNPSSSRSHALLQIQLSNSNQQVAGRMWFVDLAGSERASDTKEPDKQCQIEGAEINQSLLALKECIRALDRGQLHKPFRQSKLTQVLKPAFIGDSMTCMIANISPGHGAVEHTLNTLRYADRVKELKGKGGLQERRGSKNMPSPKHNLPNSNSSRASVGPKGKCSLEKPLLVRQKADFSSKPPTTRSHQTDTIFSKSKNGRHGKEANVIDSKEIRLEHISPIRMSLDVGEKSNRSTMGENRRSSSQSDHKQSFREGPILGQQIDKQLHLCRLQKEKAANRKHLSFTKRQLEVEHCEQVHQQFTGERRSGESRKWMELRRQDESSIDTISTAEKEPKRGFEGVNSSSEERKRHLRRYHEELQKFIPSSFHLESPSSLTSLSSSVSTSFPHHSSSPLLSNNGCSGMEEYLDTYAARGGIGEANSGQLPEVDSQNESSAVQHSNYDVDVNGDAVEDWWVFQKHGKVRYEQVRGESQKRLKEAAGDGRVGKRSTTTKNNSKGRKELGLERHHALDSPGHGVCSTEQEAGNKSVVSCRSLLSLSLKSPSQQATAERPLSQAHEQTSTLQTSGKLIDIWPEFNNAECNANAVFLPPQMSSKPVPSNRHSENEPFFVTNTKTHNRLSKAPTHTKEPETTVFAQNNADPFSCIMDSSGIPLLQIDWQPATTSKLQGDNGNGSLSWFEDNIEDRMKDIGKNCPTCKEMEKTFTQYENEEFPMSFLELPQIKPHIANISDTREAATHNEQWGICGLDKTEPLKVSQDFLQDQEDCPKPQMTSTLDSKDPAFPRKHFTCTSRQTPVMKPAVQHFVDASLLTLQARVNAREIPSESSRDNIKKALSLMPTPQPENISSQSNIGPNQCYTITSDCDRDSNMSFQPNKTAASLDDEERSHQNLFTLDDLNHAKWCVVEAYWEQLREMEVLCQNGGTLLRPQPDMTFGEYVHKLEEILRKEVQCLQSMQAQLQPYLKLIHRNHSQQQREHRCNPST